MIELLINNLKQKNTDRLSVHYLHRLNFINMNSEENMFWGGILVYIRKKNLGAHLPHVSGRKCGLVP